MSAPQATSHRLRRAIDRQTARCATCRGRLAVRQGPARAATAIERRAGHADALTQRRRLALRRDGLDRAHQSVSSVARGVSPRHGAGLPAQAFPCRRFWCASSRALARRTPRSQSREALAARHPPRSRRAGPPPGLPRRVRLPLQPAPFGVPGPALPAATRTGGTGGPRHVPIARRQSVAEADDAPPTRQAPRGAPFARHHVIASTMARAPPAPPHLDGYPPFTQYSKTGFTWEDQVRTAEWLSKHKGPVVLSNQATPRIPSLYRRLGFQLKFLTAPRRISCNGDRTPAKDVLAIRNI